MSNVQRLREQRANLWEQMKAVLDGASTDSRDLSAEEAQTYDRLEGDLDGLSNQIDRLERHQARADRDSTSDRGRVGEFTPTPDVEASVDAEIDKAFASWVRGGMTALSGEGQALMRSRFVTDSAIQNAAGVGSGGAGGYAVPPAWRGIFVETLKDYGVMLQLAERIETTSGANLPWPTNDDTANVGAILGENTQVTEQDVTLGTASLDAYMYTSKLVRASFQFLQDVPSADAWLARKLAERIARILNQHFTTGTGGAQPDGIVTSATVGVTGSGSLATTGGVSVDNLIDLVESLDPAYGGGDGLRFMLHQTARKALRKLREGGTTGAYLWQPSVQAGVADSLMGYPVSVNNDMPTVAVNSKSVAFGNIREAYVYRIVGGPSALRLTERYADFLQVGFLAFQRADGTLQNSGAVRLFQTTPTA